MRNRMCVGALALSFPVSLAALPAAVKFVNGERNLRRELRGGGIAAEMEVVTIDAR